jgi:hypothetical protein
MDAIDAVNLEHNFSQVKINRLTYRRVNIPLEGIADALPQHLALKVFETLAFEPIVACAAVKSPWQFVQKS